MYVPRCVSETKKLLPGTEPPPSPCACRSLGKQQHNHEHQHKRSIVQLLPKWAQTIDRDAVHFGARMAVCLTISSLFVLAQSPTDEDRFPEGMWVLITVLFVCWFPNLLAASVLEKSVQRLVGTFIGASLGLACGFLSLLVVDRYGIQAQAICLACCIALVSFVVCCYAVHKRIGGARLIGKYNYATILCLLTFTICLMPFYTADAHKRWEKSLYRVVNVIIGCILGVGLSMMIFPRPTVCILQDKVSKQIELAGEASEAVLHTAADIFSERTYVPLALADEIMIGSSDDLRRSVRKRMSSTKRLWRKATSGLGHDIVLEKYESALQEMRVAKSQLGLLHYDPFNLGRPNDLLEKFQTETANTLARSMRIQTTVVLMDGIVRNDPKHKFSEAQLELLANVGTLVRHMLSVPLDPVASDEAAKQLSVNLVAMRRMIVDLSATVSSSPSLQIPSIIPENSLDKDIKKSSVDLAGMYGSSGSLHSLAEGQLDDDRGGKGAPKHVQGSHVCSLLFLQLAEHLALRSVRLYQSWKQCEGVCQSAEHMRASVRNNVDKV